VLNSFNEHEIIEVAKEMAEFQPAIVNFINMNPHHGWQAKELETKQVIADLSVVEPQLNHAIQYLEQRDIGVNVRYYPMCCIAGDYRRTICNDLHVTFDPYEWDYAITPKTFEEYLAWGQRLSAAVEQSDEPCRSCGLYAQCGGVNKTFLKAAGGKYVHPQQGPGNDDFYHYRQSNIRTLVCP
jgi:MoaA/NifB/PqqE/SkfB family radical SAM enzyme